VSRLIRSERFPVSSQSECREGESHGRGTQHVMSYFSGGRAPRNTHNLKVAGTYVAGITHYNGSKTVKGTEGHFYRACRDVREKGCGAAMSGACAKIS